MKAFCLVLFTFSFFLSCSSDTEESKIPIAENLEIETLYFPPLNSNTWEQATLKQLNWNEDKAEELYDYLDEKGSKGFIVLYNGRIIIEKYFNGQSQNDTWFWNSAAKSLTAAVVGIAQDEGFLNIDDKTSTYLGDNWSNLATDKQELISIKHHLSMNSGLDAKLSQPLAWTCTLSSCLDYLTDAGEQWAYHQGAFTLLFDIVTEATSTDFDNYSRAKINDKIGMGGTWRQSGFLKRYESDTRDMARFGLLMMNQGIWNEETVLSKSYFDEMINSSQNINLSYGYLWWLNGKGNFMGTGSQQLYTGSLIPNATNDMYAALGANDQKIYVVPSEKLVVIRTGDSANDAQLGPSSFDNELWGKINEVID